MIDIEKVAALYDARLDRWIAGEQQDKRGVLGQLVLLRFMIRKNLQAGNTAWETLRYYERQKNILKSWGRRFRFWKLKFAGARSSQRSSMVRFVNLGSPFSLFWTLGKKPEPPGKT